MLDMSNAWMCKVFGHNLLLLNPPNMGGGSKCIRCGHIEPAVKWPRPEKKEQEND